MSIKLLFLQMLWILPQCKGIFWCIDQIPLLRPAQAVGIVKIHIFCLPAHRISCSSLISSFLVLTHKRLETQCRMLNFGYNLFINLATVTAQRLFLTWRRSAFTSHANLSGRGEKNQNETWTRLLREASKVEEHMWSEKWGGWLVEREEGTRGRNKGLLLSVTREQMRCYQEWILVLQ